MSMITATGNVWHTAVDRSVRVEACSARSHEARYQAARQHVKIRDLHPAFQNISRWKL